EFARGHWGDARTAYAAAAALDRTCWICYWRHAEVGRWFDVEDDAGDAARYRAHTPEFPEYYRTLIRAERVPLGARLDSLAALTRRWKDFLFGQFRRGDELLHRGPLVGRSRREAAAPLEEVLKLQPEFAPGLQHLAWVHIAEGDSADAAQALVRAERLAREPRFARSAGIARVLALVGLGRPDTAIVLARALDVKPFAAELAAATVLLDADSARFVIEWPPVRAVLARDTVDRRAGWML